MAKPKYVTVHSTGGTGQWREHVAPLLPGLGLWWLTYERRWLVMWPGAHWAGYCWYGDKNLEVSAQQTAPNPGYKFEFQVWEPRPKQASSSQSTLAAKTHSLIVLWNDSSLSHFLMTYHLLKMRSGNQLREVESWSTGIPQNVGGARGPHCWAVSLDGFMNAFSPSLLKTARLWVSKTLNV